MKSIWNPQETGKYPAFPSFVCSAVCSTHTLTSEDFCDGTDSSLLRLEINDTGHVVVLLSFFFFCWNLKCSIIAGGWICCFLEMYRILWKINHVRPLHCSPRWKMKIWKRVKYGAFKAFWKPNLSLKKTCFITSTGTFGPQMFFFSVSVDRSSSHEPPKIISWTFYGASKLLNICIKNYGMNIKIYQTALCQMIVVSFNFQDVKTLTQKFYKTNQFNCWSSLRNK